MIKLLNSNFYRLKKSMTFWVLLIVMAFLGMYIYLNYNPINCSNCDYNRLGEVFFTYTNWITILLPIFISLFIGTEYSDGGLKNKIIKGHTRTNIYLSNLLTCIIVSFAYSIIYIISLNIMGLLWGNHIAISTDAFLILLLDSVLLNIYTSSLFTFITMSISNKTSASIISFSVIVWSVIISGNIAQKLSYATGIQKLIYQLILNMIPSGQSAYQLNDLYVSEGQIMNLVDISNKCPNLWLYSLCFLIIVNFYGIIIFNKKQLN